MRFPARTLLLGFALAIGLGACQPENAGDEEAASADDSTNSRPGPIMITAADHGPEFPETRLKIFSPAPDQVVTGDSVMVSLDLQGLELQSPTAGEQSKGIAFSSEGQHVHVIIDDKPYAAVYVPDSFKVGGLSEGAHAFRAFPSRSWHESVKTPAAFVAHTFYVGSKTGEPPIKPGEPLLTYSRPKGTYKPEDSKKVLLDFYLVNAELAPDKYKVRVTIDGKVISELTEWRPYLIENLPAGEHTIKLELLAPDGSVVPGKFNTAEQKFTTQ